MKAVVLAAGEWLNVGRLWEVLEATKRLLDGLETRIDGATLEGSVVVEDGADVGPNAVVSNAVVLSDATIEAGAVIKDCIVGENATVGPNSTVVGGPARAIVEEEVHQGVRLGGVIGDNATLGGGVVIDSGAVVGDDATVESGVTLADRVPPNAEVRRG
ncbi:NDP-sugar synthase [Halobacterium salinarum]|uniref:nucleotidyltransferase family protein n=1 Tax=Halobacterium salinarum TaxID=2242 RepID=UPI0025568EA5|nr:NDP-sugar synthase [Halobacterium salinarum]MDL0120418.1 NDP-sugar synthase [Halobacterium salinarum]